MSRWSQLSRRGLLRGGAGLGSLLALDGLWGAGVGCGSDSAVAAALSDGSLERLLPGKILRAGATNYEKFTTPWNLRWVGKRPKASAIVRAQTPSDVAAAIRWSRDHGVPLVPRSGGHSYGGYSTTEGIVLDVSQMRSVSFDSSTRQVTLGGGARNADIYASLPAFGATLTHGRCKQVGVAGLILGGGVGFNMRRLGLTCDQLLSTDMVTASGDMVTCSATQNEDLFWAVRGAGGGNFGVHTSFRLQTHEALPLVVFNYVWTDKLEQVLRALADLLFDAPRGLGAKVSVTATPNPGAAPVLGITLLGQFTGSRAELAALFARVFSIAVPATTGAGFERESSYWDGQEALSDEGLPEFANERSHYCIDRLSDSAISLVFERLRAWPQTSLGAAWKGFVTGGAIRDVAANATAFVHRKDWMLSTIELNWTHDDSDAVVSRSNAWLDSFHDAMAVHTSQESYQNFIDDAQKDWQSAYHGANLARLVQVKRAIDSSNFFHFAQSIPVSL